MWKVLQNRDFALLWSGQVFSRFGDGVYAIALAWLALDLTGSALALGVTLATSVLPALLFGMVIGTWVDRWNSKRLLIVADITRALLLGVLLWLYGSSRLTLPLLVLGQFCLAVLALFFNTARGAVLPQVLAKEQITAANALQVTSRYIVDIGGKLAGGLIVVGLGMAMAFVLNTVSFLVSVVFIALAHIPEPAHHGAKRRGVMADLREFLGYLQSNRSIVRMMLYLTVVNIGVPAIIVGLPVIAKFRVGTPAFLGIMEASFAVGGVLSGMVAVRLSRKLSTGTLTALSAGAFGLTVLLMGLATTAPYLLLPLIGLSGALGPIVVIYVSSFLQKEVPSAYLGRAMALQTVLLSVIPVLALTGFGAVAQAWGIEWVLTVAGGLVIAATVSLGFWRQGARAEAAEASNQIS